MTKTPYELRYELLAMAQSILVERNMNDRIKLENDWNAECEKARFDAERTGSLLELPKFPEVPNFGVDYLINVAERLNAFVSKNS